jgi:hypothetical protein
MLKKSLIVIAMMAIALPAVAGDLKVHGFNSRTVYDMATVPNKIKVILDVGYYLHVLDQNAIKVSQDSSADDPYRTYTGCATRDFLTNFPADVKATIASSGSAAGGEWSVTLKAPGGSAAAQITIPQGTTPVDICVKGLKINLEALTGGDENVHVADITIHFIKAGLPTS